MVPGAVAMHPSKMVPSASLPSIQSKALVVGAAAELEQVTVPEVYDAIGTQHERAVCLTVEAEVYADIVTVSGYGVLFQVSMCPPAICRCRGLTGVATTLLTRAVDVTARVVVGVRKNVHALLILAVNALPVSLQPATRL
jgi:hypothetical protein